MKDDALALLKKLSEEASGRMEQASNLARAIASRAVSGEKAPTEVVRERHLSCFGREPFSLTQITSPCPALSRSPEGTHHCLDCGCPQSRNTALDVTGDPSHYSKLEYPWLACPRKKKGFSNHEPP